MRAFPLFIWLPLCAVLLASCNDMFGKKTKLDFIVPPQNNGRDVSYVPILPFITGLQAPTQILAGNDNLLYVVDSAAQALICYDEALREQSRMTIPGIRAVAQDRTLDLLVLGAEPQPEDTSKNARPLATIYRISMKTGVYRLGADKIVKKIQHPFYTNRRNVAQLDYGVTFRGISVLPDNRYVLTRSGVGVDPITQVPYDGVLLFDNHDRFSTTISITGDGGQSYSNFFKLPTAIATIPARSLFIPNNDAQDFLVTTLNAVEDTVLRVRYISVSSSPDAGTTYSVKQLASTRDQGYPGVIYEPGRFSRPMGLCVASDETGFIFVSDRDTLYQFTGTGVEGVVLRAQSSGAYNKVSFGGTGNGVYNFNKIRGIAYSNKVVYVADMGNKRICRYKLSSDFQ